MAVAAPSRFGVTALDASAPPPVDVPVQTGFAFPPPAGPPIAPHPGWAPPVPPPPVPPPPSGSDGRLLDRRAGILVAIAIGLGAVMQGIGSLLGNRSSIEPATLIRYDLVLTLGLYAVVAVMIVSQITPSVSLRWGTGRLVSRAAIGVAVGAGLSGVLLWLISAGSGHLRPDPRIVLLMSEGDATHIVITVLITCLAAPLIEETLFRGLLLESIRPRGTAPALLLSAFAFAIWHLNSAALIYYSAMGAVLGGLYIKRGLAASIAAHVGFNGVLTVAAIAVVLGPSHVVDVDGVAMTAPSGWSVVTNATVESFGIDAALRGPDDAIVEVIGGPYGRPFSADTEAAQLQAAGLLPSEFNVDVSSVREMTLPVGQAVEADVTIEGQPGSVVTFASDDRSVAVVFLNAGSSKAKSDFTRMLESIHPSP